MVRETPDTDGAPAADGLAVADITATPAAPLFVESATEEVVPPEVLNQRICDFDLRIEGRPLGRVVERFLAELVDRGIVHLKPRFYLTDEWGVPEGTVAIGIPFYLADERLLKVHEIKEGLVEGTTEDEILRYLRHEMGHVVNYAYRLYETEEWTRLFGPMSRPYQETYRPLPFSPDFVRHLPGGYAQKHPDEDWAETFAVWMDPVGIWRDLYSDSPGALQKLEYCDAAIKGLKDREPAVTSSELDLEASLIHKTVQEYYEEVSVGETRIPHSLDGDLRMIFAPRRPVPGEEGSKPGSAPALLRRHKTSLANSVYAWTAVDPDLLKQLQDHLISRAADMKLSYRLAERDEVLVRMTGFLTTLAMNYVYRGNFVAK